MKKRLTKVGNSKAIILPPDMIKKYDLAENELIIEETEEGILIRPAKEVSAFAKALDNLRKKKQVVYKRMKQQANDPSTKAYYATKDIEDVDTGILDS